ncbi:hypothetical protein DPMN_066294 [Dreissena polymorpha]|uniref:Uncharacterized protein n=1 Tax=Dreissena polymorpha TaxID=45954 RepID=A0A9D3YTR4_DREPO|nr:hypothetical protein DPMN_066294 [Dreissena polymorpha]
MKTASPPVGNEIAPPSGGHVLQRTGTIFKLSLAIIKTNALTMFHEDLTINVTPRVITRKTALLPDGHIFQRTRIIFKPNQAIIETNVMTKFREELTINVTSRVLTGAFSPKLPRPLTGTILELSRHIIRTNVLTKFHEDLTKKRLLEKTAPPPGGHVFCNLPFHEDWIINFLTSYIIGKNLLTKFNEHQTINVACFVNKVKCRRRTTDDARQTKGDHKSSS